MGRPLLGPAATHGEESGEMLESPGQTGVLEPLGMPGGQLRLPWGASPRLACRRARSAEAAPVIAGSPEMGLLRHGFYFIVLFLASPCMFLSFLGILQTSFYI